jgi:uncharacterized protein (TIGR02421 family)
MKRLKIEEIIKLINRRETFEAASFDNSFHIKINRYVPYCCTAIHDGSNLRTELRDRIALDEYERWYEEDPHTGLFIDSLPITIVGMDSRFEYDLNRRPEECLYEEAWGKKVWKRKLTPKEQQQSLTKHANFYKVVDALIGQLADKYGSCVVYDIHSYNHRRWDRPVPLFNTGTEKIDGKKFGKFVDHWQQELASIELKGIENQSNINDVFYGRGYNLEHITSKFPNVLVLATEVKKVYCNEATGEDYPEIVRDLQQSIKEAILNNAQFFSKENTNWKSTAATLLDKKEDAELTKIDTGLFRLLRNFELLAFVNPVNSGSEYKRFAKNKYRVPPVFKYSPIKIDAFALKQKLSSLKINSISDVSIRNMYESVVNSYFDKIDLLSTLNTKKFLYNSLRYFGRPSKKDLQNAHYLLHLPSIPSEPKKAPLLSMEETLAAFRNALDDYQIDCKLELSNKVISKVMVLNSKNTILIRRDSKFTHKEVNALIEHEIGVHMVTTQNSMLHDLKLFNIGLPVNTMTQEGLAILSEYISGNITMNRLKNLALRVIVVDMLCTGADFMECYHYLTGSQKISSDEAFTIVTRVFRGGGFTKDYLYLSGFVQIWKMWNSSHSLKPLLIGKTSLEFYDTIKEMIDREMLVQPKYLTKSFVTPNHKANDPIYDYIISGLK